MLTDCSIMKKTNTDNYPKHKIILLLSGIVLFAILLAVLFFVLPSRKQTITSALQSHTNIALKNDAAQFITAITFKHLSIYPFICDQNGYTMKNYQNTFIGTFSPELKKYKKYLTHNNLTEIQAWDKLPEDQVRTIFFNVDSELQLLADKLAKQQAFQGKAISIKDACAIIDNRAASFFEENLKKEIKDKSKKL